MFSNV
jgi:hypothetical protein